MVPDLRDQIEELITAGFLQVIIDLRGLSSSMSPASGCCSPSPPEARYDGWRLSLIQGSKPVRRIFALTDTLEQLPFTPPKGLTRRLDSPATLRKECGREDSGPKR